MVFIQCTGFLFSQAESTNAQVVCLTLYFATVVVYVLDIYTIISFMRSMVNGLLFHMTQPTSSSVSE